MGHLQKKIVAFVFLLIMAVPVFISVNFILQENMIQEEVDEKMNTVTLQSITVAKVDIVWLRAGKEILLGDRLFDVKNVETKNDSLILTGYFDTEETELLAGFKKYTESNNNDSPLSKSIFKFLFSPVFNHHYELVYEAGWLAVSNQYHLFSETLPPPPSLSFTHPPQL
jgi:hypothetical protein